MLSSIYPLRNSNLFLIELTFKCAMISLFNFFLQRVRRSRFPCLSLQILGYDSFTSELLQILEDSLFSSQKFDLSKKSFLLVPWKMFSFHKINLFITYIKLLAISFSVSCLLPISLQPMCNIETSGVSSFKIGFIYVSICFRVTPINGLNRILHLFNFELNSFFRIPLILLVCRTYVFWIILRRYWNLCC